MARVRIFLPTYRRPALLPRSLASLRAQTFTDWVCEIHNDDPADPGPDALVQTLGDPRITLVKHTRNLGGTESFHLFFRGTVEPFYSLLEDDNWWEPDFLETMLATAEKHPQIAIFWANMHVSQEQSDGSFQPTGRTLWPVELDSCVRLFSWGHPRQIVGALHSNGAALYRSIPGRDYTIPSVPFSVIEPFRERTFPHPLALVTRPLATFSITQQSAQSRDPLEWAETQAMLAATFFRDCPWSETEVAQHWEESRRQRPPGTTNLILAAVADPAARKHLHHARLIDWWLVLRGMLRRPLLLFRLCRSQRRHAEWWAFLETFTRACWQQHGTK